MLDDYPTLTTARTGPATLPSPELVFETFRDDFDVAYEEGTLFLLTLHPHVVGMRSRIGYLDELLIHEVEAWRVDRDGEKTWRATSSSRRA